MIVTCERCETQFQLDEARVPETGARVRCSRCKHAFVVHPPAANAEAEIERAVDAAVNVGETPDVTEDLPDPVAKTADKDANADSDWQFNHDDSPTGDGEESSPDASTQSDSGSDFATDFGVVGPDEHLALAGEEGEAASDALAFESDEDDSLFGLAGEDMEVRTAVGAATAQTRARGGAKEPTPDSAETLGTPDEWDIFDDLTAAGKKAPASAPTPRIAQAATASRALAVDAPVAKPVSWRSGASASRANAKLWLAHAAGIAGWAFTAVLCAIGFAKGLAPPSAASPETIVAAGLSVERVAGRWVDNARLGKLYVVSGELRHERSASAPMPPLELVMLDAAGRDLEPTWPLDSPRPGVTLREGRSNALSAMRAGFRRPLQAGEARDFEAVAWPLPRDADRFEIRVAETGR